MPLTIKMLERHPLGTQLFMPLHAEPFLVVVAPVGEAIDPATVRAFLTNGRQGISYGRGVWHHPLIAFSTTSEFLVIDRAGKGANCDSFAPELEELILQPDDSH
jgi:ureidoglycolate lyase